MHPTNRGRRLRVGVLVLFGMAAGAAALTGQEPAPPPARADSEPARNTAGAIIVPIGVSQNLSMASKKKITAVQLDKDGVVRAAPNAVDPTSIVLTGISAGTIRLTLTDSDGKRETFDVIVQLDVTYLKKILVDAVPTANVDVKPVLDQTIILTGWVSKAEDVDTILKVADAVVNGTAGGRKRKIVNAMQIGGVQQVQLDVTVAQVNRTESRSHGFNFLINGTTVQFGSILGGLVDTAGGGAGGIGTGLTGIAGALPTASNIVLGVVPWGFTGLLEALRDEGLAKLLAEPKLVTLSGKSAYFLSGGQQAVISATSGLQGPGIEFKNIGTELTFLPIVQGNGRIYLEVVPRVRTVNAAKGLQFQGTFVPGFDEQSVQTALEIEPGQTMAIGGLIQNQVTSSTRKVPILGDLPYLGSAFNRVLYKDDETELVILVTPHLVDPQDCRQSPKALPGRETRKPDDYELFLESIMEAPRGPRQVFEGGRYKAAYKSDPTYNQYPCADPLPREKRHGRAGRGGAYGGSDGSCGTVQSTFAPNGPMRAGEMMTPSTTSPLLPGAAMPGPALGPGQSGRMIPPTEVESLPAPKSGRERRLRTSQGPTIPQPRFDEDSPR